MNKLLGAIGMAAFLGFVGLCGEWETHYTRLATCVNVDYETHIYSFVDNSGNIWEWEGDYFEVGNVYRLHMSDNHSTTITDDYIRKIKKY